jgi:hypothetical protein
MLSAPWKLIMTDGCKYKCFSLWEEKINDYTVT